MIYIYILYIILEYHQHGFTSSQHVYIYTIRHSTTYPPVTRLPPTKKQTKSACKKYFLEVSPSQQWLIVGLGPGGLGFEGYPSVTIPFRMGSNRNPNHLAPNQRHFHQLKIGIFFFWLKKTNNSPPSKTGGRISIISIPKKTANPPGWTMKNLPEGGFYTAL